MNISVFQIYFDELTKKHLEPEFIPYFNDKKDGYFEKTVMKDIYEKDIQADYIGISSWKQRRKTRLTGKEIIEHIENDISQGKAKDAYMYTPISGVKRVADGIIPMEYYCNAIIKAPDIWSEHKAWGQPYKDDILLNNSGVLPFNIFDGKWVYCHCNYFIVRKSVFEDYCKNILLPTLHFFERPDVKQQMHKWYKHSHEGQMYTSASFVMEGLFGAFLAHRDYSYSYIHKKKFGKKLRKVNIIKYEKITI